MMFENTRLQCLKVGKVNRKELYDSTDHQSFHQCHLNWG